MVIDRLLHIEDPDDFAERLQNNFFLGRAQAQDVAQTAYKATLARRSVDVSRVDNLTLDKGVELTDNL